MALFRLILMSFSYLFIISGSDLIATAKCENKSNNGFSNGGTKYITTEENILRHINVTVAP